LADKKSRPSSNGDNMQLRLDFTAYAPEGEPAMVAQEIEVEESVPDEPAWMSDAPEPMFEVGTPAQDAPRRYIHTPNTALLERITSGLNPQQREAVLTTSGPLLIIAGPGSGKTRVLTHRIANLIEGEGVWPSRICAVTFTNKAAAEMKHRLAGLIGERVKELTVGTFHALGVRILRQDADAIGYKRDFAIYDDDDQVGLVKQAMRDIDLDDKQYSPRGFLSRISAAKAVLVQPEEASKQAETYFEELAARVYRRYQELLFANRALDFDDLIKLTIELFTERPDILRRYQERYLHVLVDEYQDTSHSQYIMVKLLSGIHKNLCVVGDPDQCAPQGALVLTPGGERPIESIQIGDRITSGAGRGRAAEAQVQEVHSRPFSGKLIQATLKSGRVLRVTPNHMCFAKLGVRDDVHYVYLMYRQDKGYRIGVAVGARSDGRMIQNGLMVRTNQEHADKVWILRACSTREEALYYEHYYAFEYGIPTTIFYIAGRGNLKLTQENIDRLYANVDTRARAARLMSELNIYPDYPHHRPQGITGHSKPHRMVVHLTAFGGNHPSLRSPWFRHRVWLNTTDRIMEQQIIHGGVATRAGSRGTWRIERSYLELRRSIDMAEQIAHAAGGAEIARWAALTQGDKFAFQPAAHLRPSMIVPVWQDGQIIEDEITSVEQVDYTGPVYDLDVAQLHNYVVDGVVVHNSIYAWRAADIRNILEFERDYPNAKVIVLGQNYRSTQTILKVADNVIQQNTQRKKKELWTENEAGLPVTLFEAYDESEEAQYVAREVRRLTSSGYSHKDIAVMYRTNAQSREIEQACMLYKVPYQLVGGVRFYSRKEVKDVLSILRVVHNPESNVDFARMVNNTPLGKGIGSKTMSELDAYAAKLGVPLYMATHKAVQSQKRDKAEQLPPGAPVFSASTSKFVPLLSTLEELIASRHELPVVGLLDLLLERTRYQEFLQDGTQEGEERWQNVLELRTVAENYADLPTSEALGRFLEDVALMSDVDTLKEEKDAVTLITLHAAKGLEYPVVMIVGTEEGILPHKRAVDEEEMGKEGQMEEERRLAYVGITRAKQRLYLIYAFRRTLYGMTQTNGPSRFIADVPPELVTGRDPGTAFQPSLSGGKRNTVPERGLSAEDILRGNVSIYGKGKSGKSALTPSDRRPTTHRVENRREDKREERNVRLNITSAADLRDRSRGTPSDPSSSGFKVGEKVRHHAFGEGQVLAVKRSGSDEEVTVMFKTVGTKRLLASMARLERIG
jgi:DNA helicase-2/ATP-dependent DNA helicase PcrA